MAKATIKQKLAFNEMISALGNNRPLEMREIMLKAGYREATAKNPELNLLSKAGFKRLLDMVDDSVLLAKSYSIAMDQDKRASLAAIDMILKLKDRYPDKKLRFGRLEEELKELTE